MAIRIEECGYDETRNEFRKVYDPKENRKSFKRMIRLTVELINSPQSCKPKERGNHHEG